MSPFFQHNFKIELLKLEIRKLKTTLYRKVLNLIYLWAMEISRRLETIRFSHEIKILTLSCTEEVNLGLDAVPVLYSHALESSDQIRKAFPTEKVSPLAKHFKMQIFARPMILNITNSF